MNHARQRARCVVAVLLLGATGLCARARAQVQNLQTERERQFAATMDGARLVGKFTLDGSQGASAPQDDLYSISKLEKGADDTWIFSYNMSHGDQGMTVPIPVRVLWAGDTPVLTMSEQSVPGFGSFTVRLLIYQDRYAGTWSAGTRGGHMWGRIEHPEPGDSESQPAADSSASPRQR